VSDIQSFEPSAGRTNNVQKKILIYRCICGAEIHISPDLSTMNETIQNHVLNHNRLGGHHLTEDSLTHEILKVVIQEINKIC
jgi:hypothetical protein